MTCSDPCEGECPPLPDAFVRLRYFFGKRLGVADLRDEQAYHRGKIRFHERHLHGSGVVCGLALSKYESDGGESTVLEVGKGAALDTCGREIVVGQDQCIDLGAWYRRRVQAAKKTGETFPPDGAVGADGTLQVCVAVRYRECPTSPESAPRDPCACDTGGCEYGRVVEGFELSVLLEEEAEEYMTPARSPGIDRLREILASAKDGGELAEALAAELGEGCAEARDPDWIVLGCLSLPLVTPEDEDAETEVGDLPDDDTWTGPPSWLLSTSALQDLLLASLFPAPEPPGPLVRSLAAENDGTDDLLVVQLGAPLLAASVPIDATDIVILQAYDTTSGWGSAVTPAVSFDSAGKRLLITPPAGTLVDNGGYRLRIVAGDTPMVDDTFRPLVLDALFRFASTGPSLTVTWQSRDAREGA